ncbi:MAG: CUAEP/CCAEP-tail radical SAM protein [Bryobacteraceae bacterium]
MRVTLVSTYESGRQPFGLAAPAALLRQAGHEVTCADAAVDSIPLAAVKNAELIAFYLPMHTATRLAAPLIGKARAANPEARLCCYGLYATLNEAHLRSLGVQTVVGGEFEAALVELASGGSPGGVRLERIPFATPYRAGLPPLARYAAFAENGNERVAGYTEASRGCKHLCRHCPVVPVYEGKFRVVPIEVVLADIRQQVEAGAEHVTFGDPDFCNGPAHARRIVERLHREFPGLTYDVTIKVEHLLRHRDLLPVLAATGCRLVTSAAESVDDAVLAKLDKGHTRADFVEAVALCRATALALSPTFIPFTPWTTRNGYLDLLRTLADLDLVANVSPVQLALRLLIPAGSRLLELDEIRSMVDPFEGEALVHRWRHSDPELDRMAADMLPLVDREQKRGSGRATIFAKIWERAAGAPPDFALPDRATIPYLTEPWYC